MRKGNGGQPDVAVVHLYGQKMTSARRVVDKAERVREREREREGERERERYGRGTI